MLMGKMCVLKTVLCLMLLAADYGCTNISEEGVLHRTRRQHRKVGRTHRDVNDGLLHFEPTPYNKNFELHSSGKIHCKVAGGKNPTVNWFLNTEDPLPEGVTSANGTLLLAEASREQAGQYTCLATEDGKSINVTIHVGVVVAPRVLEPQAGLEVHVTRGDDVWLDCRAAGDPEPMTHWDRNRTMLTADLNGVENEDSMDSESVRIVLMRNGTLVLRNVSDADSNRYACTAGSSAGLARNELTLIVHPEGVLTPPSSGVAGKAVVISISVALAYMLLVLALMLYCRRRRERQARNRGEKIELEAAEGREKLVEDAEDDKSKRNGVMQNGRLLAQDSGADNSEMSAASRASKRSGHFDHLSVPRTLITDTITLGRGEFGDVLLGKIDLFQVKRLRSKETLNDAAPKIRPVLIKALSTKDENQLAEFRRIVEMFSRIRSERVCRLVGLCNDAEPHYLLIEHTDWGDLKQFLASTRTASEREEYMKRIGPLAATTVDSTRGSSPALTLLHQAVLVMQLAQAGAALAQLRLTHRDIAARNCVITSKLQLKLSCAALSRGPYAQEYYKLHDQVIPLRWLPLEAALESDYSTKSDVYMFAAAVWEIFTKAELPFAKLNDNSVMDRMKSGTLEWIIPNYVPEKIVTLLNKCWSMSPTDRPLFDSIVEDMKVIHQEISEAVISKSQENIPNIVV